MVKRYRGHESRQEQASIIVLALCRIRRKYGWRWRRPIGSLRAWKIDCKLFDNIFCLTRRARNAFRLLETMHPTALAAARKKYWRCRRVDGTAAIQITDTPRINHRLNCANELFRWHVLDKWQDSSVALFVSCCWWWKTHESATCYWELTILQTLDHAQHNKATDSDGLRNDHF